MYQEDQKVLTRRKQSDRAVKLAMANRWEDAVVANRAILEVFPNDTDSYNRLGKALTEIGRFPAAKKAYKKALELDTSNQIAKKNLDRLPALAKSGGGKKRASQANPSLFIEEMGKTALTTLDGLDPDVLIKLTAGDLIELEAKGDDLIVKTSGGDEIGVLEPRLRSRILKLMDGGSAYAAAVTSLEGDACHIIIKETQRDPSQSGPSFPTAIATPKVRPYTKSKLIQYDNKVEASSSDGASSSNQENGGGKKGEGWEDDSIAQEGNLSINAVRDAEDVADDDELEE